MKTAQVARLISLAASKKNGAYINSCLRQLRYLGKIIFLEGDVVSLPYYDGYDSEMLSAIDIMLDLTEKNILTLDTDKPFKLSFVTEFEEDICSYAIMPVPAGMEKRLAAEVAATNIKSKAVIAAYSILKGFFRFFLKNKYKSPII